MNKPLNNHVQAGQLNHVKACEQPCSSWSAQPCSSVSNMFRLASSTMFKPVNNHACSSWPVQPCSSLSTTMFRPVNNHVQPGQFNHVQVCQQPCSSWLAQPCPSLSTGKNKLCVFTCVVDNMIMKFSSGPDSRSKFRKRTGQNDILHYYCAKINRF